jgi:hypothetical protein
VCVCARKENGGEKKGKGKQILSGVFFQIQNGKKKKEEQENKGDTYRSFLFVCFLLLLLLLFFV